MIQAMQKLGLTPAKGALIALLAGGMGWVWSPLIFGESKPQRHNGVAKNQPAPTAASESFINVSDPVADVSEKVEPLQASFKMTLSEATRHDPFAPPSWAPKTDHAGLVSGAASPDQLQQRFEALAATGVAMVIVSDEGRAAQIGDRTVQVGDVIDGFRVIAITATGVKFEPEAQGGDHGA